MTSACVSPRVNTVEPWTRGSTPFSMVSPDSSSQSVFGFRYDTLEGHIEQGFEWFLLQKRHAILRSLDLADPARHPVPPQTPTFRSGVQYVEVDVTVLDEKPHSDW